MLDNPRTHFGHSVADSDDFDVGVSDDGSRYIVEHLPSGETTEIGPEGFDTNSVDAQELSVSDGPTITNLVGTNLSVTNGVLNASGGSESLTGVATRSGDGSTTTFTIPHNQSETPPFAIVQARSADASPDSVKTVDDTNITIEYATAPPSGTDNLEWRYVIGVGETGGGTSYSDEQAQDATASMLTASENVSLTYDDANNTLSISATDTDTDTQAYSLASSGSTTLSSGSGTVDTGVGAGSGHYDVNVNPGSADIAVSLDGSGSNYQIHIEENTTSIGNPTVDWQLVESQL